MLKEGSPKIYMQLRQATINFSRSFVDENKEREREVCLCVRISWDFVLH